MSGLQVYAAGEIGHKKSEWEAPGCALWALPNTLALKRVRAAAESTQPEDWDTEEDGEWEAPSIPNPKCKDAPGCGAWTRPQKPNPAFKGKWAAPMIDNPEYKARTRHLPAHCICRLISPTLPSRAGGLRRSLIPLSTQHAAGEAGLPSACERMKFITALFKMAGGSEHNCRLLQMRNETRHEPDRAYVMCGCSVPTLWPAHPPALLQPDMQPWP